MLKKKTIAIWINLFIIVVALGTFDYTFLYKSTKILAIIISSLGLLVLVLHFKSYPKILRQSIIGFMLLYLISAATAYFVHQQSFFDSYVANLKFFLLGSSPLLYYIMIKFDIKLDEIKNRLVKIGWVAFFVYLLIFALYGEGEFDLETNEIGYSLLNKNLIILLSLAYLISFFKYKKNKYFILSLVLYSATEWGDFQRSTFILFILILGYLAWVYNRSSSFFRYFAIFTILLPVVYLILNYTKYGEFVQQKLSSIDLLFEEDSDHEDSSIESRVIQLDLAYKSIAEHPISGIGRIRSTNKKEAFKEDYFFVSDIGIVGVIFTYGIFGLLMYLYQIRYVQRLARPSNLRKDNNYSEFVILAAFFIIMSLFTGITVFSPEPFLIVIALIEIGKHTLEHAVDEK